MICNVHRNFFVEYCNNNQIISVRQFSEAVTQRCSVKKVFLKISRNLQENTCARFSFLIKLQASGLQLYKKETLAKVFSGEFFEISKNTFSYRTPPVAASEFWKTWI